MKNARIWNEIKNEYEFYELPKGASTYETDMNKVIQCACCGKKLKYGEAYTSHKIHTPTGFGYAVCKECYFDRGM